MKTNAAQGPTANGSAFLRGWKLNSPLTLAVAGLLAVVALAAFSLGRWSAEDGFDASRALAEARGELRAQQLIIDRLAQQREHDINATSVRLAELQAVATRLDALGGRLVDLAQIDDGEFSFDSTVPVGGPEQPLSAGLDGVAGEQEIDDAIAALSTRLRRQSAQLDTLQELLMGRQLEVARRPSGWPVMGGWVSSGFGDRTDPFTGRKSSHTGIDIAGPLDSDVLSVAGGVVTWAGARTGFGQTVEIDHGNGYVTRYAHNAELDVAVGDTVVSGQRIGRMGSSGRASGQHVHFEVHRNGQPVNPANFLKDVH